RGIQLRTDEKSVNHNNWSPDFSLFGGTMSELTLGEQILETVASRRRFLRTAAVGLAVPAALSACGDTGAATPASSKKQDHSGGTNSPHVAVPASAAAAADEMDRMHEAGVKAFPAKTEGKG